LASTQQTTPTLSQKRIQQNIDDEKTMLMDPETLLPGGGLSYGAIFSIMDGKN
jgi:hypothetical protein